MERNIFLFILFLSVFTSCQKTIHLNLEDQGGHIVIEGNVVNRSSSHYVRITKSVAFAESNQYPSVENAIVIIGDDHGQIDTLQYVSDGRYKTTHLLAIPGNTYTLRVKIDSTIYTAQSTMPQPVTLERLQPDSLLFAGKVYYGIVPVFVDPPEVGNYYRFVIHINGRLNKSYNSFSDNTNNGFQNTRSVYASVDDDDDDDEMAIKRGDTVRVEMQCIDARVYTYFTALAQISQGGFGGGITPANPPSNITNGAMGVFSAHTSETLSVIIR